jgi:hypothetical protein
MAGISAFNTTIIGRSTVRHRIDMNRNPAGMTESTAVAPVHKRAGSTRLIAAEQDAEGKH